MATPTDMDLLSTLARWETALADLARTAGTKAPFHVMIMVERRDTATPYDVAHLSFQAPEALSAHQAIAWETVVAEARAALEPLAKTLGRLLRQRLPVITGPHGRMAMDWILEPDATAALFCDILEVNDAHLTLHGAPFSTALLVLIHHLADLRPTESAWVGKRGWPHKHSVGAASEEEAIVLVQRLRHVEATLRTPR